MFTNTGSGVSNLFFVKRADTETHREKDEKSSYIVLYSK